MLGDKIKRFMYGRYGVDQFGKDMLWLSVLLSILSMILNLFKIPIITTLLSFVSTLVLVYIIYRTFSKNINKRVMENNKYLGKKTRFLTKIKFNVTRAKDAKNFVYIKCPNCKNYSRVPRGKGKIKITCRVCKTQFDKKV